MVTRFQTIMKALSDRESGVPAEEWPARLACVLGDLTDTELAPGSACGDDQFRQRLREVSALGSMLMHLKAASSTRHATHLVNTRRNRAPYSTYPTSPKIGAAMAHYVWRIAGEMDMPRGAAIRIIDPTMEGAPLLLELALEAARCRSGRPHQRVTLCGVDQNPIAAPFVRGLFRRAHARFGLDGLRLDARSGDALDALEASSALQGIVNNPPWGAATDGAKGRDLAAFGPFHGYRDPYIAYVATGLRKLQPGGVFGFVVPFQVLTAASAARLRQELLDNAELEAICHLPRSVFPRLTMRTVMILGRRARDGERRAELVMVRYPMTRRIGDASEPSRSSLKSSALLKSGGGPWVIAARSELAPTFGLSVRPLGELSTILCGIEPYGLGRGRPKQTKADLELRPYSFATPGAGRAPVARGRTVRRFCVGAPFEYVRMGPWLSVQGRHMAHLNLSRVFVREICGRNGDLVASVAPAGIVARRGLLTVTCGAIAAPVLCAILNSALVAGHVRTQCAGFYRESFGRISAGYLRALPIPSILLERAEGAAGRAIRARLKRAVARASNAARGGDCRARDRAMADIDRIVEAAYER
jgi:hypothetical protein